MCRCAYIRRSFTIAFINKEYSYSEIQWTHILIKEVLINVAESSWVWFRKRQWNQKFIKLLPPPNPKRTISELWIKNVKMANFRLTHHTLTYNFGYQTCFPKSSTNWRLNCQNAIDFIFWSYPNIKWTLYNNARNMII